MRRKLRLILTKQEPFGGMQPLHPHPLPQQNYRERSCCSHPSTHGSPTQPRLHALISRPQTLPHARLQRNYFRPCKAPASTTANCHCPELFQASPEAEGIICGGKSL